MAAFGSYGSADSDVSVIEGLGFSGAEGVARVGDYVASRSEGRGDLVDHVGGGHVDDFEVSGVDDWGGVEEVEDGDVADVFCGVTYIAYSEATHSYRV